MCFSLLHPPCFGFRLMSSQTCVRVRVRVCVCRCVADSRLVRAGEVQYDVTKSCHQPSVAPCNT